MGAAVRAGPVKHAAPGIAKLEFQGDGVDWPARLA
jgi:hypothetical protein